MNRVTLSGLLGAVLVCCSPVVANAGSCEWTTTPMSPSIGTTTVKAFAPNDAWADGFQTQPGLEIERWDGQAWKVEKPPNGGSYYASVNHIDGLSDSDMWIAGSKRPVTAGPDLAAIWHHNGLRQNWYAAQIPPTPNGYESKINNIKQFGKNDVWALGQEEPVQMVNDVQYVLHWNGVNWVKTYLPTVTRDGLKLTGGSLLGLSGTSDSDLWVAGVASGGLNPVVERYDGVMWDAYSVNPRIPPFAQFTAIFSVGRNDVWAVGNIVDSSPRWWETLAEHWDGSTWSWIPTISYQPGHKGQYNIFFDVSGSSSNDVWAVGMEAGDFTSSHNLAEHWDGVSWTMPEGPYRMGAPGSALSGVSVIAPNEAWAVEWPPITSHLALYYCSN